VVRSQATVSYNFPGPEIELMTDEDDDDDDDVPRRSTRPGAKQQRAISRAKRELRKNGGR
jgi:hypothetical protein